MKFGGKPTKTSSDSKRHFTVVMGGKEHGLYVSSTPSSAARKAVTKLCTANKSKKVQFEIREITQGSKKKTYGPYKGYIEKLKEPIELKGRVIRYKPVAKLSGKKAVQKGGEIENLTNSDYFLNFRIIDGLEKLSEDQKRVLGFREDEAINQGKIISFLNKSNCYIWKLSIDDPFYLILKITKGIGSSSIYIAFSLNTPPLNETKSGTNANIILAIGDSKENFLKNLKSRVEGNTQYYKQELIKKIKEDNGFSKHSDKSYMEKHFGELKYLDSQNVGR